MIPTQIKVEESKYLKITWGDASVTRVKLVNLRRACPCADCNSESEQWTENYIPLLTADQFAIAEIIPLGNYGIAITWKDGHKSGYYEYEYLKSLNEKE